MLTFKPGVKIDLIQPQMVLAAQVIAACYAEIGCDCVITAGNDGQHMADSLHYKGHALDIRTRSVPPEQLPMLVNQIRLFLGENFDVVLEGDHLHAEYDPKDKP